MKFSFRDVGFVGRARRPSTEPVYQQLNNWNFTNLGSVDAQVYNSTGVANTTVGADYAFTPRLWVNHLMTGNAIRFPRNTEGGGSNNSHYRAWVRLDTAYLTANSMLFEGRIKQDVLVPASGLISYRGMPTSDATFYWHVLVGNGTRYLACGFDGNSTTYGVFNTTTGLAVPAVATAAVSAAPGWHTIDFRYKLNATTGYVSATWDGGATIGVTGINSGYTGGTMLLYTASSANRSGTGTDLNYFGGLANVYIYKRLS